MFQTGLRSTGQQASLTKPLLLLTFCIKRCWWPQELLHIAARHYRLCRLPGKAAYWSVEVASQLSFAWRIAFILADCLSSFRLRQDPSIFVWNRYHYFNQIPLIFRRLFLDSKTLYNYIEVTGEDNSYLMENCRKWHSNCLQVLLIQEVVGETRHCNVQRWCTDDTDKVKKIFHYHRLDMIQPYQHKFQLSNANKYSCYGNNNSSSSRSGSSRGTGVLQFRPFPVVHLLSSIQHFMLQLPTIWTK